MQGTHVVVAQAPAPRLPGQTRRNANSVQMRVYARTILGLSITQVIIGLLCVVMGIVLLVKGVYTDDARLHANGIWSGIFFVLTGVFGIVAGKTKKTAWIVTTMVFCIISAVVTITTLGYGIANITQAQFTDYDDSIPMDHVFHYDDYSSYQYRDRPAGMSIVHLSPEKEVSISMGSALITMAVAEAVLAIVCACFCCHAVCCCSTPGVVYTIPADATVLHAASNNTYYSTAYPGVPIHIQGQGIITAPPAYNSLHVTQMTGQQPQIHQTPGVCGPDEIPPPYESKEAQAQVDPATIVQL